MTVGVGRCGKLTNAGHTILVVIRPKCPHEVLTTIAHDRGIERPGNGTRRVVGWRTIAEEVSAPLTTEVLSVDGPRRSVPEEARRISENVAPYEREFSGYGFAGVQVDKVNYDSPNFVAVKVGRQPDVRVKVPEQRIGFPDGIKAHGITLIRREASKRLNIADAEQVVAACKGDNTAVARILRINGDGKPHCQIVRVLVVFDVRIEKAEQRVPLGVH